MKEIFEGYKDIIKSYEIICWDSEPGLYRFKAKINFVDSSVLIVKDYLFRRERKYSYQWQDEDNNLIIRWDNATHWKKIDTFPHHKHVDGKVFSSREITLQDILDYIYNSLKKK